jgi:hypothetical protein
MAKPVASDDTVIQYIEAYGIAGTAKKLGVNERSVYARRRTIEGTRGITITPPIRRLQEKETGGKGRLHHKLKDGIAIVGSDTHYWPGLISTAHAGLVRFCEDMKPAIVILDGDVVDGAAIGRHARIGWEYRPDFADELEAVQDRLGEIEKAAPRAKKYWPLGNHDARMETLIANQLPQLERVNGVHLKDHFNKVWNPCWSLWINDSVVVKHRFKGGLHAAQNNALWAGKSIVTGHLHRGVVYPITDYQGTRYGVDMPWMGENYGPQVADYTEDNPVNWRSGFAVLTFIDGQMCQPELAFAVGTGVIEFRGQRLKV